MALFPSLFKREKLKNPTSASLRGVWFVSHAYEDAHLLAVLTNTLPDGCHPFVHPAVNPNRRTQVSDILLRKIRRSKALVYPDAPATLSSPWCTMERDYARRSGKSVWKYLPDSGQLIIDTQRPADLYGVLLVPLSGVHSKQETISPARLLRGLRARHFDILTPQELSLSDSNWRHEMEAIFARVKERQGIVAMVLSDRTAGIVWEVEAVLRSMGPARILLACCKPGSVPDGLRPTLEAGSDLPARANPIIQLWSDETRSATHRLDDFIVTAYSLYRESVLTGRYGNERATPPLSGSDFAEQRDAADGATHRS